MSFHSRRDGSVPMRKDCFSMCNKRMGALWICLIQAGEAEKNMLHEFVTLSGASTTSVWNSSITHVIAAVDEHGACSRTLKGLRLAWRLVAHWQRNLLKSPTTFTDHLMDQEMDD
ncbi:hypothetical protein ZIOFF_027993 [Zingiber officinale]|uniref:Uncharacterized protein n=1 Tax=Zingiber officinale TaxID=94328 RepID=A0A8J5H5A1_ZINOF|nr:hypothetical protein ZIOFF_027993 [Zingiber officinale]